MLGERGRANPALASIEVATVTVTPPQPPPLLSAEVSGQG